MVLEPWVSDPTPPDTPEPECLSNSKFENDFSRNFNSSTTEINEKQEDTRSELEFVESEVFVDIVEENKAETTGANKRETNCKFAINNKVAITKSVHNISRVISKPGIKHEDEEPQENDEPQDEEPHEDEEPVDPLQEQTPPQLFELHLVPVSEELKIDEIALNTSESQCRVNFIIFCFEQSNRCNKIFVCNYLQNYFF